MQTPIHSCEEKTPGLTALRNMENIQLSCLKEKVTPETVYFLKSLIKDNTKGKGKGKVTLFIHGY